MKKLIFLAAFLAAAPAFASDYSAGLDLGDTTRLYAQKNVAPGVDAEVAYDDFGHAGKYSVKGVDAAAVLSQPVAPNTKVYGKVGVAATRFNYGDQHSGVHTDLLYGFGAEYAFTPNVSVRAEMAHYNNVANISDVNQTELGVKYHF